MGKTTINGAAKQISVPVTGTPIYQLSIGSVVKIKENNVPVEYIKVHQGIPSSLYDASCNGAWMLRKDCYENRKWHGSNVNDYEKTTINAYLNNDFYKILGSNKHINQVRVPYRPGAGDNKTPINGGANGLLVKVFLLSAPEVGFTTANTNDYAPMDGARLAYFPDGSSSDPKRVAYLNSSAIDWWLRSPDCDPGHGVNYAMRVRFDGRWSSYYCSYLNSIRPCIIIDNNATVDDNGVLNE